MSVVSERDLRRQAILSLFLLFPETSPTSEMLDGYLDTLSSYRGDDTVEACRRLHVAWKSRNVPRPAHIVEEIWKVIDDRKRSAREGAGPGPHMAIYGHQPLYTTEMVA